MYYTLISLVIGLFLALLFLNVYFRVKVLKSYKNLVNKRVEFGAIDIFKRDKIDNEIIPKYPNSKDDIIAFTSNIRKSVNIAIMLVILITLAGAILKIYA